MKQIKKKGMRVLALVLVLACSIAYAPSAAKSAFAKKKAEVKSVKITNASSVKKIYKGKTATLKVKVTVKGKISKKVKFKSSNTNVATVSGKGVITAKKEGTSVISVTSVANKKKKASVKVTVARKPIKSAVFASTVLAFEKEGATLAAPFSVALGGTDDDGSAYKLVTSPTSYKAKDFNWTTSDSSAVTVNSKGKFTVKKYCLEGVDIIATAKTNSSVVAKVTVYCYEGLGDDPDAVKLNSVSFENPELAFTCSEADFDPEEPYYVNFSDTDEDALSYELVSDPEEVSPSDFIWKTSNDKVIQVDENGRVAVVGFGKATVTAIFKHNPKKNATITFTIYNCDEYNDDEDEDDDEDDDDDDEDDEDDEDDGEDLADDDEYGDDDEDDEDDEIIVV